MSYILSLGCAEKTPHVLCSENRMLSSRMSTFVSDIDQCDRVSYHLICFPRRKGMPAAWCRVTVALLIVNLTQSIWDPRASGFGAPHFFSRYLSNTRERRPEIACTCDHVGVLFICCAIVHRMYVYLFTNLSK